jgi:hypothetical protein
MASSPTPHSALHYCPTKWPKWPKSGTVCVSVNDSCVLTVVSVHKTHLISSRRKSGFARYGDRTPGQSWIAVVPTPVQDCNAPFLFLVWVILSRSPIVMTWPRSMNRLDPLTRPSSLPGSDSDTTLLMPQPSRMTLPLLIYQMTAALITR